MVANRELTDAQRLKIERLLPKVRPSSRGGRRRIYDREVLEGILCGAARDGRTCLVSVRRRRRAGVG
jgi:hypothetical protein